MMEEDFKPLPVGSNDQLYHILKTDSLTFCLICLEDINTASDGVRKHLTGANHAESIKRLLKACNPSLLDEVENERFADIVSKSVFDISVLLGKETCYVSKTDGFWFCLMCEKSIIESNVGTDAIIKTYIIDHILSDSHVQNVKEVCFLYKYNANQDFLLLNKSVVYCSVCKDVMQCKELDLLRTAIAHLEKKHPNHAMTNGFQFGESIIVRNKDSKTTEQGVDGERMSEDLVTLNMSRTELAEEVRDELFDDLVMDTESSVEIAKDSSLHINSLNQKDDEQSSRRKWCLTETNICVCLCCKTRVALLPGQGYIFSIINHFERSHRNIYIKRPMKDLINHVTFHNDPDKINLIREIRKMNYSFLRSVRKNWVLKRHLSYILKTTTDYVCILCMVSMSPCLDENVVLFERLQDHFNSLNHLQCEQEHIKLRESFKINTRDKTIVSLTAQRKQLKQKIQMEKRLRKERQAKNRKLKKLNKNKKGLMKLEVKPIITHEVKTEIH